MSIDIFSYTEDNKQLSRDITHPDSMENEWELFIGKKISIYKRVDQFWFGKRSQLTVIEQCG